MLTLTIIRNGSILNSSCDTIVNPINCVGVMGKGLALELKNKFPNMFERYVNLCKNNLIEIGKLWLYCDVESDKKILNFPTKKHWKEDSKYEYIELGMEKFVLTYKDKGIKNIAFPMIGCGNGNLDKEKVLSIITKHLFKCDDIIVEIYF